MRTLTESATAAEERKRAAGIRAPSPEIQLSSGEMMERAIFSGFEIDHEELTEIVNAASWFFLQNAPHTGLSTLFKACWTDGLLVGLMHGSKLAPHHTTPGGEDAAGGGTEGEQ